MRYKAILLGLYRFYSLAHDIYRFNRIHYILRFSAAHTLAAKHRMTVPAVFKKYGSHLVVARPSPEKRDQEGRLVTTAGKRYVNLYLPDRKTPQPIADPFKVTTFTQRSVLVTSPCRACGSTESVEMHHVRHLKDLNPKLSAMDAIMAKIKRKQIPLCAPCHRKVHGGKYSGPSLKRNIL